MGKFFSEYVGPLAMVALAGVVGYDHFYRDRATPDHTVSVNGAALGKAYTPIMAASYADAWIVAAQAMDDGKSVAECQNAMQAAWKTSRAAAFHDHVEPGFSLILPAGTEPADPSKRAQVSDLWRAFARGLKGGK